MPPSVKILKGTQSINANQWPDLILSSITARLKMEWALPFMPALWRQFLQILHELWCNSASRKWTRGYATMVHGRGCNPHRLLWRHWWHHNSETTTYREKRRPPHPMKSSELSNGDNCIALRQLLQNRKWRHLWRRNLGSRRKLQKMAERILVLVRCTIQPKIRTIRSKL